MINVTAEELEKRDGRLWMGDSRDEQVRAVTRGWQREEKRWKI